MPDTQTNPIPPGNPSKTSLNKIDALEKQINYMVKAKRKTTIATYIGLVIIIIFIGLFIFNLFSFVKNYNTEELASALSSNVSQIAQSEEVSEVLQVISNKYLPALQIALVQKIKSDAPQFRQSSLELTTNLREYLRNHIKPKLKDSLIKQLSSSESQMLTTYSKSKPSLEKINIIIKNSQQFLLANITKSINFKLENAMNTLTGLNGSFQKMYASMENTPVLKGLTPDMAGEVENRLIEALLEIIIYQLNPQKGNMPAFAKGGSK